MRVLVVDDDEVSRLVLVKSLETLGDVVTAADGEAGLDAVRAAFEEGRPFDLLCLDIMMPKKDGQTLLKDIRALEGEFGVPSEKEAKIIMTTALNDPANLVQAVPRCDAYLTKPVDRGDLMFYIRKFGLLGSGGAVKPPPAHSGKVWGQKDKDMPWVG